MNISVDKSYKALLGVGLSIMSASAVTGGKIAYEVHEAQLAYLNQARERRENHDPYPTHELTGYPCPELSKRKASSCRKEPNSDSCATARQLLESCEARNIDAVLQHHQLQKQWLEKQIRVLAEAGAAHEVLTEKLSFRKFLGAASGFAFLLGLSLACLGFWRWHLAERLPNDVLKLPRIDA